ncbi:hypothetical protein BDF14DRAFT_1728161, partial [Spinellus fusiger]
HRVWNRDVVAALNFRHILHSLHENQKRPERFSRSNNTASSTGSKRKNTPLAVSSRLTKIKSNFFSVKLLLYSTK